ncbi:MAG TPA: FAD-binding oxidoreductase [Nitrospiraceae bacterium]|nr:FAD-binding oxidoreductase [Nitrospiraceae bacterium]
MVKRSRTFEPAWRDAPPGGESYRSIFMYDTDTVKHPGAAWLTIVKKAFGMTDADFKQRKQEGDEKVVLDKKSRLSTDQVSRFTNIVGEENVQTDDYSRVKYGHGKSLDENIELRRNRVGDVPDIVVHPRNKADVQTIVAYCNDQKIPIIVYSGGSSVVLGLRAERGGVALVLGTHMNKVLTVNDVNQTATVQPGLMGPDYENTLNNAPELFGTKLRYTCGHFPQSFAISSVGGWILTLGSGQESTYYGDAYDIVLSQEYITPAGVIKTLDYPGTATGPKVNDIMKGSEGAFGILVEATMKIFRSMPENHQRFAFLFPSWQAAVDASREIIQGEFGLPAVYRISDPEETEIGLTLHGIGNTAWDRLLILRGFLPMKRSLCIGTVEGEKGYAKHVKKRITKIARRHGAQSLTSYAAREWEKSRYSEFFVREDFLDYGIVIDTLESGVTWDNLDRLYSAVRSQVKKSPGVLCLTHASHFYPQGTNLYFIFMMKPEEPEAYATFRAEIIDTIVRHGGSLSHHHGIGKLFAPWMEKHLGKEQMNVLKALKRHFDPNAIMNPGGQLGLDGEENPVP